MERLGEPDEPGALEVRIRHTLVDEAGDPVETMAEKVLAVDRVAGGGR